MPEAPNPFRANRIATDVRTAAHGLADRLNAAEATAGPRVNGWRVFVLVHNGDTGEAATDGTIPTHHALTMIASGVSHLVELLNQRAAALTHGKDIDG